MTTAFPLAWPEGFPRSKNRGSSQFKTSLSAALENVRKSLLAFNGARDAALKEIGGA